jgi:hypothetical protein
LTASSSAATTTNNQGQSTATYASSVPTNIQTSSTSYSGSSQDFSPNPPAFPKVLKIEERRVPRGDSYVQPYCIQKILDQNGVPQILPNSTGQPTIVYLNETEPSASGITDKRDGLGYVDQQARDLTERQNPNVCGCVWMWT